MEVKGKNKVKIGLKKLMKFRIQDDKTDKFKVKLAF
jgi:hypothetical protein